MKGTGVLYELPYADDIAQNASTETNMQEGMYRVS